MVGPRHYPQTWLEDVARRYLLVAPAKAAFPSLREKRSQGSNGVTYVFTASIEVPTYESRRVRIEFRPRRHSVPTVFADGPTDSPHRYRSESDRSLCIWYPSDDASRRWEPYDGLLQLLGLVAVHLFKEAYWREHPEWLGDEAPHGEVAVREDQAERKAA